ncbi:hypothetical protein [Nakamurella leprariae]|uniref:Uncharacterized protein n=1 Tax=Nakamurella leprariae TaxID=2803911 RepID=A0A938YDY8_9ACTN|nr:hypothetical protein [Nakamurella leprariae]MBM9468947.1 hypothetical protein [Nakamurella leprariae]
MTPAPWWLLTTFRRWAGIVAGIGAAALIGLVWVLLARDRSWSPALPMMIISAMVLVVGATSLATLARRPELRGYRFQDLPITRRGARAWRVIWILGLVVVIGLIILGVVELRSDDRVGWLPVGTLLSCLLSPTVHAQRRRPVTDDRAGAAASLVYRP